MACWCDSRALWDVVASAPHRCRRSDRGGPPPAARREPPSSRDLATTEHFNLQTERTATIGEANGRASIFLGSVSAGLIALGFATQGGDSTSRSCNARSWRPTTSPDLAEVEARLLAFQRRYEQTAAQFDWQFTRSDLDRLLRRLEEHEHPARTWACLPLQCLGSFWCRHQARSTAPRDAASAHRWRPKPGAGSGRATLAEQAARS
jgi:hypothetical protein